MSLQFLRSTFHNVRINEEDDFVCPCGFPTKEFLVKKKPSPYNGTKFYACAKHLADTTRCDTMIWLEEENQVRDSIPPAMQSPRTPKKQVDIRIFGHYTAPTPSSKRNADTPSFDSAVGDMGHDGEPASPSRDRTAKRAKFDYADAAAQTEEGVRSVPVPATRPRPISRPLPRRRLFDEYLPVNKKRVTPYDPFAPRPGAPDSTDTSTRLGPSVPLTQGPPRKLSFESSRMKTLPLPERNDVRFNDSASSHHPRQEPLETKQPGANPRTPPSSLLKSNQTGLITPQTQGRLNTPQLHRSSDSPGPETPTKSTHTTTLHASSQLAPRDVGSDEESFGWNDDLDKSIFEVVEGVEERKASPLVI